MAHRKEPTDGEFLRDLAERLMRVPPMYGTDQGDVDKLNELAKALEAADSRAKDE